MKVIFYSHTEFADCTFPLIKELQNKGIDAYCYLEINRNFKADNIIEFKHKVNWFGFYKASKLKEFDIYKNCIDLNRVYIIAPFIARMWWIPGLLVWLLAICHMFLKHADVLQIDWQLAKASKMLMWFPIAKKKIMTVHDPIIHGNTPGWEIEDARRKKCFKWADKFILLNEEQLEDFSLKYKIEKKDIYVSHLGAYNSISDFPIETTEHIGSYVLFWGRINPYKGLEYLLEAAVECHKLNNNFKLIIAGKGDEYFDFSPYRNLDFIEWRYRYIGINELVNLIRNCQYAVCPYIDATQSGVIQTAFVLNAPVIATNVGALPKAVTDGVTGKIVPPCDSKALAQAMIQLWNSPNEIKKMRNNIRNIWLPKMGWTSIADDYINVYKE